jgi:adenylosuccinate synthase
VKICVAYRVRGQLVDEMPLDADDLAAAEPVYEELPGWSDTDEDVPPNAARFVMRVSALAGIPIWVTSVGPARAQTIVARNPFNPI